MKPSITILKRRSVSLLVIFCIFFIAITARLSYIQFSWGNELKNEATKQWTREIGVYPKRGTIYDSNGLVLAASVTRYSLQATPNDIKDAESVALLLSPILDMTVDSISEKLNNKKQALVWIKRLLSDEQALQIRNLAIPGLDLIDEPARVYPFNDLAAQVLGFTMKYADPKGHSGQEGIELYYNTALIGEPGTILRETDNTGKEIPFGSEIYVEAQNGNNIVLTLDSTLQMYLQEACEEAMQVWEADSVYAIATNPKTGEIYAMVNLPDYDPNEPPRNLSLNDMQALTKNMTCQLNFDPGSVFKAVILAAAIEENVVTMNDQFYCPGYKVVTENGKQRRIYCSHRNGHGAETTLTGLGNSCNPVFMEIGEKLGKDKVYEYIKKFGFGQKTGIDVSGEESGIILPYDRAQLGDWLTMCFGQAIAVTPIQMIMAYNAVINGGYMIQPHLLKSINRTIENENGTTSTEVIYTAKPQIKEQVISESTSAILRDALIYTVSNGTASTARLDGYNLGGKTGTSNTYSESGAIDPTNYIGSFIGAAPGEDPIISVYIISCNPKKQIYGNTVAAPYVKDFLQKALPYLGVEQYASVPYPTYVPNLIGLDIEHAMSALSNRRFDIANVSLKGNGNYIVAQSIPAFTILSKDSKIELTLGEKEIDYSEQVQIPNLVGLSLVDATRLLLMLDIKISTIGVGDYIVSQDIVEGTYINKGSTVTCSFDSIIGLPQ